LGAHHCIHDEKERRRWQNPEATLRDIGLSSNFTFVDLGCGDGFFALPAARLVGKKGRVYALDENHDAIARLNEKATVEGLENLETKVGEAERVIFCERCADIVFLGIVLHDFSDPVGVLRNAKRMLKATGRLIDLDWRKEPMELGPPLHVRFSEDEAVRLIESVGLKISAVKESGPFHYMIIAEP
jgi:ubiquinone/menaquinone biosynthesis C-methylase UbiE